MTSAVLAISDASDGGRVLALSGRLDSESVTTLWDSVRRAVADVPDRRVVVDASGVDYCDGAGIALFVDLLRHPREPQVEIANLKPAFEVLLKQFDPGVLEHDLDPEPPRGPAVEEIGRAAYTVWRDIRTQVTFVGETTAALAYAFRNPASVRWRDVWRICEQVGADALPIVALISFLLGMILAFQSAVPMKRFGAEIFVADLIGLSMLRELGPLMTAILLAGRSGAAFAAEIGTMRVNQEVDALTTMGLDPVRFLVTPRVIAALLMTPLLTLFANLVGLIGGAITMTIVLDSDRRVPEGGRHRGHDDRLPGRIRQVVRVRHPGRRHRLPARPADGGGRLGRRRFRDQGRRLGHHPAGRRRRHLRRRVLHAQHMNGESA